MRYSLDDRVVYSVVDTGLQSGTLQFVSGCVTMVIRNVRVEGALHSNDEPIGPDYANTAAPDYFNTRKVSIYAGSNEVQRNIMAKMVLGL